MELEHVEMYNLPCMNFHGALLGPLQLAERSQSWFVSLLRRNRPQHAKVRFSRKRISKISGGGDSSVVRAPDS